MSYSYTSDGVDIDDIDALAVRDQVAPIGALRRCKRRGDDLEVDGIVGVGENEQRAAAIGERILHAGFAGRDQARWSVGIGEVDQPLLGGFMVAAGDYAKSAGRAFMDMGEPAGIALFINQNIVGLRRSQAMPPDLHRAVVVVEFYVEEAFAVARPHHRAVGLLDDVLKVGAGSPVAHANSKIFRALDVGAPGLEPVIRRMPRAAELEVFMVRRKLIAIEHDFDRAAVARGAAEHLVLAAL